MRLITNFHRVHISRFKHYIFLTKTKFLYIITLQNSSPFLFLIFGKFSLDFRLLMRQVTKGQDNTPQVAKYEKHISSHQTPTIFPVIPRKNAKRIFMKKWMGLSEHFQSSFFWPLCILEKHFKYNLFLT